MAAINQVKSAGAQVSSKPVEMRFDVKGASEAIAVMNNMKTAGMTGGMYNVKVGNAAEAVSAGKQINATMAQLGDTTSKVKVNIGQVGEAGNTSFRSLSERIKSMNDEFLRMARIIASVAVAYYLLRGAVNAVVGLLQIVDDFNVTTIGIAATLTDMAKEGQGPTEELYRRNKAAAHDMYASITLEAAKHFATAGEMMTTYNRLVQSGYAVRQEEVGALGLLTDKIKLATKGQGVERQLNTEIMALMEGQARAGSLLALELKSRLGPGWKDLVQQHKQAGDLLSWLMSLYPGLVAANKDIENTMASQAATTKSLLELIAIGGLGGAYKSVVETIREMNDYLRENRDDIVAGLISSWIEIKWTVRDIVDYYQELQASAVKLKETALPNLTPSGPDDKDSIDSISNRLLEVLDMETSWKALTVFPRKVGEAALFALDTLTSLVAMVQYLADLLSHSFLFLLWWDQPGIERLNKDITNITDMISRAYTWVINIGGNIISSLEYLIGLKNQLPGMGGSAGPSSVGQVTTPGSAKEAEKSRALLAAQGVYEIRLPGSEVISQVKYSELPQTVAKGRLPEPPKGGGKGGGGADAERNRLNSLFDTLTKDIARLSEGKLSEIEANYVKTVEQIYKKTSDRVTTEAELVVLAKKRETLQKTKAEEEYALFVAKNGNDQYAEIDAQAKKWLSDYRGFKDAEVNIADITARRKIIVDVDLYMKKANLLKSHIDAMASESPYLVEQLAYKKQSLVIENELAMAAIKKAVAEDKNLEPLKDQLIANQKLLAEAKKYTLERAEWEKDDFIGGAKIYGVERANEAAKRGATEFKSMMASLESTLGDALGTTFINTITGKKTDLKAMLEDTLGDVVKSLFKSGVARGFDLIGGLLNPVKGSKGEGAGGFLSGLLGTGKPDGSTAAKALHVTFDGAGGILKGSKPDTAAFDRSITKANKTGMTLGGESKGSQWDDEYGALKRYQKQYDKFYKIQQKDIQGIDKIEDKDFKEDKKQLGGMQKLQDKYWKELNKDTNTYSDMQDEMIGKNQDLFTDQYLTDYEGSFSGVMTNTANVFSLAQGIMTTAGITGDAQRLMSFMGYATQVVGVVTKLAKGSILADAYRGAAAAYAAMAGIPVVGPALGAVAAAVTFAAISAYGMFGGDTTGIATGHTGMLVAHNGMFIAHDGALLSDERMIKAQVGEGIIKRDTMSTYLRRGISFDMLNNGQVGAGGGVSDNSVHIGSGAVTVTINNPPKDFDANKLAKKLVPALQQQIGLNRLRSKKR